MSETKFGQHVQTEAKSSYLNSEFGLRLALKKLNITESDIEKTLGRYGTKSKYAGTFRGSLHWFKIIKPGFCPTGYRDPDDATALVPGFVVREKDLVFGFRIQDYDGNVIIGPNFGKIVKGVLVHDWKLYYQEFKNNGDTNINWVDYSNDLITEILTLSKSGIPPILIANLMNIALYHEYFLDQAFNIIPGYDMYPENFVHVNFIKKYNIDESILPLIEKLASTYRRAPDTDPVRAFFTEHYKLYQQTVGSVRKVIDQQLDTLVDKDSFYRKIILSYFLTNENEPWWKDDMQHIHEKLIKYSTIKSTPEQVISVRAEIMKFLNETI